MPDNHNRGPRVADLDPQSKVHLGIGMGCGAVLFAGALITGGIVSCEPLGGSPEVSATPTAEGYGGAPGYWGGPEDDSPSSEPSDTPSASPSASPRRHSISPSPTPTKTKPSHKPKIAYCPLVMNSDGAVRVCRKTTAYEFGLGTVSDGHSFSLPAEQFVYKICGTRTDNTPQGQTEVRHPGTNQRGWVINSDLPKGGDCKPS